MVSSLISGYSDNSTVGTSFGVGDGYGKGGLGTRTTYLTSQKLIVVLMVVILCHIRVGIICPSVIHKNTGPIIYHILAGSIIVFLLIMVEVLLFLGNPTSPP